MTLPDPKPSRTRCARPFATARRLMVGMFLLAASACGRSGPENHIDLRMQTAFDAGHSAYGLEYLPQALRAYETAFQRARAVNDGSALGVAGYNLAVVNLKARHASDALRWVETTERDLAVRGIAPSTELALAKAAAFSQLRMWDRAATIACHLPEGNRLVTLRAHYFCGLSAIERSQFDVAGQALRRLEAVDAAAPRLRADRYSLQARLKFAEGAYAASLASAQQAADAAREAGDSYVMRDMLSLASLSAERLGQSNLSRALAVQVSQSATASASTTR